MPSAQPKRILKQLKILAKEIVDGEVTYPIPKSIEFLNTNELLSAWDILAKQSTNHMTYQFLIKLLDSSGTLDSCCIDARSIIDTAWSHIDQIFA